MDLKLSYKNAERILEVEDGEVPYLRYPLLSDTGIVKHGFSTRLGGVSEGCYASMNLSFTRGDREEDVRENFCRIADAIGVRCEDMVFSQQTHTSNVRVVTEADRGMGITRPLAWQDVDGLVTDVPGICLVTFYADCVPLFFVDPVKKVIGLSHSGWRGTVKRMGQVTVDAMKEAFGTKPEDLIACVGPSICRDCFEVGGEVVEEFREAFWAGTPGSAVLPRKRPGKYQLDLWKANEIIFREAGIHQENIHITNICTCATAIISFHTGKWGRSGETWQRFCALSSVRSAKEKGRGAIWMYYWRSGLLYAAYRLLWRTTDRRSISTFG